MPNSSPSAAKGSNRSKDNKPAGVPEPKQDTRQALPTEPRNGDSAGDGVSAAGRPSYEQIAQRAYEIYEREGRQPGREVENWLRAEAELATGTGTSTSRH
jgi:hypothetical protein